MMEAASDGDERLTTLGTKIAEMRGYPVILTETKRTTRGKARFLYRGDLFVGMLIVKVIGSSTDRAEAKRSFEAFVAALEMSTSRRAPHRRPRPSRSPMRVRPPSRRRTRNPRGD